VKNLERSVALSLMILVFISMACRVSKDISHLITEPLPAQGDLELDGASSPLCSCTAPQTPEETLTCDLIEANILNTTVRFQINSWIVKPDESGYLIDRSIGHGTVKDGRYLVTHNHFGEPFSENPEINRETIYGQIEIFDTNGTKVGQLPVNDVSIVLQDEETLVLDFQEVDGAGFFETMGFSSAGYMDWHTLPLATNAEVAQVDWDGKLTRVDWTTIQEINTGRPVAELVMFDELQVGASGGGVFFGTFHIGNNWTTVEELDPKGAVVGRYSTAALNSNRIVEISSHGEDSALVSY